MAAEMTHQQAMQAIADAEAIVRRSNTVVRETAKLAAGKLQSANVDIRTLCKLKKELERYNMHTGQWKD